MGFTRRVPQRSNIIPITTPAPTLGLNTQDNLAMMDPSYGLSIQNFIATPQGLSLRTGYRYWATNLPTHVTSLLVYNARINSGNKLFAVAGGEFYDVTTGGDMSGATPDVSGQSTSNTTWQSAQQTFSTSGTNYLIAVNGFNAPQLYDGTSWTACTQVSLPSAPGQFALVDNNGASVNIADWVDVCLHQQRLWFVQNNSTKAMYLDIASIGGTPKAFDFGSYFARGARLHKLASWTIDSGNGQSSQLVAISSKGDVVVYQGTDPSSPSTWSLLGTYQLGSPVGRRNTLQMEGDLLNLTLDGLYPMSRYMQSARLDAKSALTYNISNVIASLAATYGNTKGFEMALLPSQSLLVLNIPQSDPVNNYQFVFNTETKGWTQFTGWPAQCWSLYNDSLFFGGDGFVALGFFGYKDGADITGAGGSNIVATALSAFDPMSNEQIGPGFLKHAKLVMPFIVTGQSNPTIRIGVNTDFNLVPIVGSATVNPVTGAVWDNAKWNDPSATWVGSLTTCNRWATPRCFPGTYLAIAISISAVSDALWVATNWRVAPSASNFG